MCVCTVDVKTNTLHSSIILISDACCTCLIYFWTPINLCRSAGSYFDMEASTGEYAEIGPATAASAFKHTTENQNYSHIKDTPSRSFSCSFFAPTSNLDLEDGCHITENPYDALTCPKNAETAINESEPGTFYSRLDRLVPNSSVQPSVNVPFSEILSEDNDTTGQPEMNNAAATQNENNTCIDDENEAENKHNYTLEEPSIDELVMDSWSSDSGIQAAEENGNSNKETLDNFKVYDISRNPYDHLESHGIFWNHSNVEQFIKDITLKQNEDGAAVRISDEVFKYSGDYERDPMYMERLLQSGAKPQQSYYQALVHTTMNPVEDYAKLLIPNT